MLTETLSQKSCAGAEFEVIETDSDAIAKQLCVSVYAYNPGSQSTWLRRRIHPKTLIFQYEPWNSDEETPTIEAVKPGKVQISIGRVSHIRYQRRDWNNLSIDYKIGFVEYR